MKDQATIEDQGDTLRAVVAPPDHFKSIDETPAAIDEGAGVYAIMGVTPDDRVEIHAFLFAKAKGNWTPATVQSWLAQQSFDSLRRQGSDRGSINTDGKAQVTETEAWYVIKDNVLTKDGAFNRILRPASVFDKSWLLYEGVPITHPHPDGIVEDMSLVGGIVRNVRVDRSKNGVTVLADYHLAKSGMDGLAVQPDILKKNAETVKRVRAGKRVDNSQGYLYKGRPRSDADPAGDYQVVMEELVPNHLAILLDEEGACNWNAGCGVGRLGAESKILQSALRVLRDAARQRQTQDSTKNPTHGDSMPCDGTCEAHKTLNEAKNQLKAHTEAMSPVAVAVGAKADASCSEVSALVIERLTRLAAFEAAEKKAHESLAKEVATIARKLGDKRSEADALKHYASFPTNLLADHKAALEGLAQVTEGRKGSKAARFEAESQESAPARRTVGFPSLDASGQKTWS